jgi:hypothetical protein
MITPALLVIPLVHFFGRKIENPPQSRLKSGGYRKRGAVARYRNPAPPRRADQPGVHRNCSHDRRLAAHNRTRHALDYFRVRADFVVGFRVGACHADLKWCDASQPDVGQAENSELVNDLKSGIWVERQC